MSTQVGGVDQSIIDKLGSLGLYDYVP